MPLAEPIPRRRIAHHARRAAPDAALRAEIRAGLAKPQKELPSRLLYDDLGTALFEAITYLPEYGLTRADQRLMERHARAMAKKIPLDAPAKSVGAGGANEIAGRGTQSLPGPVRCQLNHLGHVFATSAGHWNGEARKVAPPPRVLVAELGSGSGRKTRPLLEALSRQAPVHYFPIDVSAAALTRCRLEMQAGGHSGAHGIHVVGLEGTYLKKLAEALRRRQPGEAALVLFLGSTIGNFDSGAARIFLWRIRGQLRRGDFLLLGADLEKPVEQLLAAYDDRLKVTAAFNLNLLAHINRDFGGNFDLAKFRHQVRYDAVHRRVEMHLASSIQQRCKVAGRDVAFETGETIWTESSHKFSLSGLRSMAAAAGFRWLAEWIDPEWPFCEALWQAADSSS